MRGTPRPTLRPGFSVVKHRVYMGKWGKMRREDCLLPLLSMQKWPCLFWTDPLNVQWQRTSCIRKSRCRGWRGSGSHQDRDSFRGPEQRTGKVRKFLCLLIQRIHFSVVSFILLWYVFTALFPGSHLPHMIEASVTTGCDLSPFCALQTLLEARWCLGACFPV